MNYALVIITVVFASGIGLGMMVECARSLPFLYWLAVGMMVCCIILARWKGFLVVGSLVVVGVLGLMRFRATERSFERLYERASHLNEVIGTVVSYPNISEQYISFIFDPDNIPAKIRVTWFGEPKHLAEQSIYYGDRLRLIGRTSVPDQFADFDYRGYLARQGIFAVMTISEGKDKVTKLGVGRSYLLRLGDLVRHRLLARLDQSLSPAESSLAHGLLLGDRTALVPQIEESFRQTGLMHLLAVSGLHLGIFLAGLWFVLRALRLRPAVSYPIVGLAVAIIVWVIGPRVSLLRAGILFGFLAMGSVLADFGIILRRWVNPLQGLAAAALIILGFRPNSLWDAGFQLRFSATASIILVCSPRFGLRDWTRRVAERVPFFSKPVSYVLTLLVVSIAAQAGTAPFLVYHFGTLYPFVLLANLVAIPLATCVLWIGLSFSILLLPQLLLPISRMLQFTLGLLIAVVDVLSRIPLSALVVPAWMGVWLGGLVFFLFEVAVYSGDELSSTRYSTSITSSSLGFET